MSTLKLSPSDKRFIIRTISSTIDKINYTKQEKEQELFYKIMMMENKLQQRMDDNKKSGILNKTKISRHNCVSTDFNVAINKKFSIKLHKMEEAENRKQNLYVIFYGYITYPDTDTWYISPIWLYTVDHTHYTDYKSAQEKRESSLGQKHDNISYYGVQQISYLSKEKAKAISNKRKNMNDEQKIDQCRTQRTKFRHFLQQKQWLWNQQKNKRKNRKQKKNTEDLKRGSRFHDFCRRNNLKINFNEYTSDRPIISFLNKSPLPTHWKIKKINQRFAIRKLLTTAHDKGKYYKLEIEIKDKFQHIAPIKQNRYRDLLKILKPWTQLRDNLRSTQYRTIPNENGPLIKKKEQYDPSNNIHEIVLKDAFISIEYLQFLTIILDKEKKPEIIEVSISLRDNTDKFIMVKQCPNNDSNDTDKLPKQPKKSDPVNNVDLYHVKPLFLKVIQMVTGVDKRQMSFSYKEIASHLTKYIFMNKDRFINKNNISIAHIRDDPLGLAFDVDYLHRTQVMTLIRKQLIPISHIKGENELLEANNIEKNQLEEDTEQKINVSLDERIQILMMQSQALRILCND